MKSFTCPYCGAFSQQNWAHIEIADNMYQDTKILMNVNSNDIEEMEESISLSTCQSCGKYHVWHNNVIIVPKTSSINMPVDDMPNEVKLLYNEAKDVFPLSPKSSCALLRLALQTLCNTLLEKDVQLNDAIKELVNKGLPVMVQQALDSIRVIGNNAVHPGEINIDDNKDIAATLFMLLNLIVEKIIIEPKKVQEVYMRLPEGVRTAIEKRDQVETKKVIK